jgi:hypothetical protein
MIFIIAVIYFFLALPLVCFLVAAVAEIRARPKSPAFFWRMVEIALGVVAVLGIPSKFWSTAVITSRVGDPPPYVFSGDLSWGATIISAKTLSWTMVCLSLLLAGLALISNYASRVALYCVVFASAVMAFLWYLNGAYLH